MPLAFVFPGQGSQYPGMLDDFSSHPQVSAALEEVSDEIGFDLSPLCATGGDEALLNDTANTQPALLGLSVGIFRAWFSETGARPAILAGHSLGEYSALVCGGALQLREAASLVRTRGNAMKSALPGGKNFGMRAVLGLSPEKVAEACASHEGVYAVNFNSPAQTVIAGLEEALEAATADLAKAGAKRIAPLAVSVPSHCAWMSPAVPLLEEHMEKMTIRMPEIPVLHNATLEYASSPEEIRVALAEQLVRPVDWVETVVRLYKKADTFIECGPGQVLTGLNKRIAKSATSAPMLNSARLKELALG